MAMSASDIERLIRSAIPDARVEIVDLAGDGDHYSARVVSGSFAGLSRVQQHRGSMRLWAAAWAANCTRCS